MTRDGMLLANFTATFSADGSSLSGDVGTQSSGTSSAIVDGGLPRCANRMHPGKGAHRHH